MSPRPRSIPSRRARLALLLWASALPMGLAGCGNHPPRAGLSEWDLPADLDLRQEDLERLDLTGPVDRVDWLAPHLRRLGLRGTRVSELRGLPRGLRTLDACGSDVRRIGNLPPHLERLDLRLTPLVGTSSFPDSVRSLAFGSRSLERVDSLPDELLHLEVAESRSLRKPIKLPETVQTLALVRADPATLLGPAETSRDLETLRSERDVPWTESLPSRLRSLALVATSAQEISSLPESVNHLSLLRNQDLRWIFWPKGLSFLEVSNLNRDSLTRLPPNLRGLTVVDSRIGDAGDWPTPLRRLDLSWVKVKWMSTPPLLEDLALIDTQLPAIPPGLRSLEVGVTSPPDRAVVEFLQALDQDTQAKESLVSLMLNRPPPVELETFTGLKDLTLHFVRGSLEAPLPPNLRKLAVHGPVESLPELPRTLQRLDLRGASQLKELPDSIQRTMIEQLVLADSGITSLPELPKTLRLLDLSGTPIDSLPNLPEGLETLVLHLGQIERLGPLPESLRDLRFVSRSGLEACPPSMLESLVPSLRQ